MNQRYNTLVSDTLKAKELHRPEFFRLHNDSDRIKFNKLLDSSNIFLHDEIYDQLKELMKVHHPTVRLSADDYTRLIKEHLGKTDIKDYGVWVYYPWSCKLVHMLDEDEFIELRTSANRNKITTVERDLLAEKKIGIIGMSVGQSVSVTLALERICGELRLADFDTLELNNLNRIRTGVHNLGILKVYAVAREIAEIDPFLKTVCYPEGITEENINDFFTKDGKLDIVIDECDGVDMKILCRLKAKELHVPVLMEASDRGTFDVERFDLHPDRPILHGWLEHLTIDFEVLKSLTTAEEKLPYMVPISGLETLSSRMKASVIELQKTVTTWPQLASSVALGGGLCADTCRRILLDQFTDSGRYFLDLETLIPDKRPILSEIQYIKIVSPITIDEIKELSNIALKDIGPGDKKLTHDELKKLIDAAVQAPSAGNCQPWKWYYTNDCLLLFHDKSRSVSFGDFEDIGSHIAFGATIENLELEATANNIGVITHVFPIPDKTLVAVFSFTKKETQDLLYQPEILSKYIYTRETNRNFGVRKPIAKNTLDELRKAVVSISGAELIIRDSPEEMNALSDIIGGAERLRLLHPEGHYEFFKKELRWSYEHSRDSADGIDLATIKISASDIVGLQLIQDPGVVKLLREWKAGSSLEDLARKSVNSASAIALITMPQYSPANFIAGGRALERMWLKAAELDVSLQPMMSATFHFARLIHGNGQGMPGFMKEEFTQYYKKYEEIFPGIRNKGEVFLFRLCIAEKPEVKSYRIQTDKVLSFG